MVQRRVLGIVVVGLAAALTVGYAWAQEAGGRPGGPPGGPPGAPRGMRPGFFGGLRLQMQMTNQTGANLPAVKEEMERHRKAMQSVFVANLTLARELDRVLAQLRQDGAEEDELRELAKEFAPQAKDLAAKQAAELGTHYENLAKIFKTTDKEQRDALLTQLAEETLNRMAAPQPQMFGPGGPGGFFQGRPRGMRGGPMGGRPAPGGDRNEGGARF